MSQENLDPLRRAFEHVEKTGEVLPEGEPLSLTDELERPVEDAVLTPA